MAREARFILKDGKPARGSEQAANSYVIEISFNSITAVPPGTRESGARWISPTARRQFAGAIAFGRGRSGRPFLAYPNLPAGYAPAATNARSPAIAASKIASHVIAIVPVGPN
jgi:hypothetical protein